MPGPLGFDAVESLPPLKEPNGILADAIDPATGDYRSITRGVDPTDGAVITALMIERGSGSAVMNVGHKFREQQFLDATAELFFQQETEFALKPLIDAGDIELDRSRSGYERTGDNSAGVAVVYTNRAEQAERRTVLSPTALRGEP